MLPDTVERLKFDTKTEPKALTLMTWDYDDNSFSKIMPVPENKPYFNEMVKFNPHLTENELAEFIY